MSRLAPRIRGLRMVDGGAPGYRRAFVRWAFWPPVLLSRRLLQDWVIFPIYNRIVHQDVQGLEHLAGLRRGVIFAPNHTSNFDAFAVLQALPRRLRSRLVIAHFEEFFRAPPDRPALRVWKWAVFNLFTLALNVFPLPQTSSPRGSLQHAGSLLDAGWNLLYFPEGWVTYTGEMHPFKKGIGLLAMETRAPVVPVYLEGLFEILPSPRKIPKPGRAIVRFGPPLWYLEETPAEFTSRLEEAVRRLGPDYGGRGEAVLA